MSQQPMAPAPKKSGRGKYFAIGCGSLAGLVILITIIAVASGGGSGNSTSGATPTNQPTQTSQATTVPTQSLKWTTTQTFSGNGTKKTAIFSVPDDWKILYTCTYQNIGGITADGALGVTVYGADGSIIDLAVNATCKNGVAKTTGDTEEHQGGQVYLDINGTGDWTIQVQQLK